MLSKEYGEYVGMDVHKKMIHATVLNGLGEKMLVKKFGNNEDELEEFSSEINRKAKIVMEASCVWQKVYEFLEAKGFEVTLAHPLKTRLIAEARIKTDALDSETLAYLLKADLIFKAYVPAKNMRELREFVRHRAMLVKVRTQIKNRVHAILAMHGIDTELTDIFGKEGMEFLKEVKVSDNQRLALNNFISLIESINSQLKNIDAELFEIASNNKDAELLTTIPGLGIYSALLVLAEIGDVTRFPSAKKLCSYAGLVPSVYQSGNTVRRGKLTKQGSKWLRWIMVQAAHHATKEPGKLQGFYFNLEHRKGKKIAIAACARKLLISVYFMLKEKKTYEEVQAYQFHVQDKGDSQFFHGQNPIK